MDRLASMLSDKELSRGGGGGGWKMHRTALMGVGGGESRRRAETADHREVKLLSRLKVGTCRPCWSSELLSAFLEMKTRTEGGNGALMDLIGPAVTRRHSSFQLLYIIRAEMAFD